MNSEGGEELETVQLSSVVVAESHVEDWMGRLEAAMQHSLKDSVKSAFIDCLELDMEQFVTRGPALHVSPYTECTYDYVRIYIICFVQKW